MTESRRSVIGYIYSWRSHFLASRDTCRPYKEGKKIGWKDGFRAIYCILKYNLFG